MKNIFLLILPFAMFCSCKVVQLGNKPLPNPRPYVQLKDGTRVAATNVEEEGDKRVVADGRQYPKPTVRSFCDGINTYIALNGRFYNKIYEGKLDIYAFGTYRPGLMQADQKRAPSLTANSFSYFSVAGKDSLIECTYKNLKMVITPATPAFHYLKLHKTNRHISTYKAIGTIGMFVGGAAITFSNIQSAFSTKKVYFMTGLTVMFGGGFGGLISSIISKQRAERNLMEAVGCYNEVWPQTRTGK